MAELHDRFGELPDEARHFGMLMVAKTYARRLGALSLEIAGERCTLRLPAEGELDLRPLLDKSRDAVGFRIAGPDRLACALPMRTGEDCRRQLQACEQALVELVTLVGR